MTHSNRMVLSFANRRGEILPQTCGFFPFSVPFHVIMLSSSLRWATHTPHSTHSSLAPPHFRCVMSIGEALRIHNHTVPCIGFSSWGCLPDVVKEALVVPPENEGEYTCSYPRIKVSRLLGNYRGNIGRNLLLSLHHLAYAI